KHRILVFSGLAMLAAASWFVLPESLQNRFETIVDPSVGPANAQESGQGRVEGFFTGLKLWSEFPATGCGPGAWRPASGSKIESHNVYGQVVGELGTIGLLSFTFLVSALFWNLRKLKRFSHPEYGLVPNPHLYRLARAIGISTVLLLFEGIFGHNLLRYNWSWYCALTAVGLGICRERSSETSAESQNAWD